MMKLLLAVSLIALSTKKGVQALDCYVCYSHENAMCAGNTFDPTMVMTETCEALSQNLVFGSNHTEILTSERNKYPVCLKVEGTFANGTDITFRECGSFGSEACDIVHALADAIDAKVSSCRQCHTHLCNSSTALLATPLILVLTSLRLLFRFN